MVYKAKIHGSIPSRTTKVGGKTSKWGKGKVSYNAPTKERLRKGIKSIGEARRELAAYKKLYGKTWKALKIYKSSRGKTYVIGGSRRRKK